MVTKTEHLKNIKCKGKKKRYILFIRTLDAFSMGRAIEWAYSEYLMVNRVELTVAEKSKFWGKMREHFFSSILNGLSNLILSWTLASVLDAVRRNASTSLVDFRTWHGKKTDWPETIYGKNITELITCDSNIYIIVIHNHGRPKC